MPADHPVSGLTIASAERQSPRVGKAVSTGAAGWRQARLFLGGALEDPELVSQREDLELQGGKGRDTDRRAASRVEMRSIGSAMRWAQAGRGASGVSSSGRRTAPSLQTTRRLNAPFSARTQTIYCQLSVRFDGIASVHRNRQEPDVGVSIEISRLRKRRPEAEEHSRFPIPTL